MKCEKCNFVSFEHNITCPQCGKDLAGVRSKLGVFFAPPEADFDQFFLGDTGSFPTSGSRPAVQPEQATAAQDSVAVEDDFEFSLDD